MRLLHPRTLEIISQRDDIPKSKISNVWSECFKFKASGKKHPKMFIDNDFQMGVYLRLVYIFGLKKDCNLDILKIYNLSKEIQEGFDYAFYDLENIHIPIYFDSNYLFSDLCSLYYKGYNLFPDVFGDDWRKYVPVESLKEIKRQVDKTLGNIVIHS